MKKTLINIRTLLTTGLALSAVTAISIVTSPTFAAPQANAQCATTHSKPVSYTHLTLPTKRIV